MLKNGRRILVVRIVKCICEVVDIYHRKMEGPI